MREKRVFSIGQHESTGSGRLSVEFDGSPITGYSPEEVYHRLIEAMKEFYPTPEEKFDIYFRWDCDTDSGQRDKIWKPV